MVGQYRTGRLIDHLHLRAADLEATKRFYKAVLDAVEIPYGEKADRLVADELYIDAGATASHVHLAFQARDEAMVRRFHAAALAAGGRDNGAPGIRAQYSPSYYAAFALDPDGNNIEAVCHGSSRRSAEAVVITPEGEG